MKISIIENPGQVLARAWSVWLAVLAALLAGMDAFGPELLAALPGMDAALGTGWGSKAAALLAALVPLARIVRQVSLAPPQEAEK
jgi:hypothetical protein